MGSLGEDLEAAIRLVIDGHRHLARIDEGNDILKYVTLDTDGLGFRWNPEHCEEGIRRFAPKPNAKRIDLDVNYYLALQAEIDRTRPVIYGQSSKDI